MGYYTDYKGDLQWIPNIYQGIRIEKSKQDRSLDSTKRLKIIKSLKKK